MAYLLPFFIGGFGIYSILQVHDYGRASALSVNLWAFATVALIFFVHPLLDLLFNRWKIRPPQGAAAKFSEVLFRFIFPMNVIIMSISLLTLSELLGTSEKDILWSLVAGVILSAGILMGVLGINSAHEWIHRESKFERALGVVTLMLVNFASFRINHVDIHHRLVATPQDPTTARKGENIYAYWLRSYFRGWQMAWQFESQRIGGLSSWRQILKHRMIGYVFVSATLSISLFIFAGWMLVASWYLISLVAILALQTVDFVEHYGLLRKELKPGVYEAIKPRHSWDSYTFFTNSVLFNLGLHSHHHTRSQLHFTELRIASDARIMKYGYSVMFLLALVPPLWRRVVTVDSP